MEITVVNGTSQLEEHHVIWPTYHGHKCNSRSFDTKGIVLGVCNVKTARYTDNTVILAVFQHMLPKLANAEKTYSMKINNMNAKIMKKSRAKMFEQNLLNE